MYSIVVNKFTRFLSRPAVILVLWLVLTVLCSLCLYHEHNNYLIFKGVFVHLRQSLPLYCAYPDEYLDFNHYGPVFAYVIAPFTFLQDGIGVLLFCLCLTGVLLFAIVFKESNRRKKVVILYFITIELVTALLMCQFNIATVALIVLSYKFAENEKYGFAGFCIGLGTFVKLYGIVGIVFVLFSKKPRRFISWILIWAIGMFLFPMLFHGWKYIAEQYVAWAQSILSKDADNIVNLTTNVSLQGLLMRFFKLPQFICRYVIVLGIADLLLILLRRKQWGSVQYRESVLALLLIDIVLFSSSSENSTYIISAVGCILWFISTNCNRTQYDKLLLAFMFVMSLLSPSLPLYCPLKFYYIQPYALKALPLTFIWLKLSWELMREEYGRL